MSVVEPQARKHVRVLIECYEADELVRVMQYHHIEADLQDPARALFLATLIPVYGEEKLPNHLIRELKTPERTLIDITLHGLLMPAGEAEETHRAIEPSKLASGHWRDYLLKDDEG